jgi:TPR repeat protein
MKRSTAWMALALAGASTGALSAPLFAQDAVITSGNGVGVDAAARGDFDAAVAAWRPLAAAGDADAQYNLAQAYKFGRGVDTDLAEAERLYGLAARQGHWRAADNYGLLLFHRGAKAEALPYLEQAAMRGDARAQYLYGLSLFNGELVERDWVRGYALMTLAQNAGLDQATRARAQMDQYIPLEQRRRGVALSTDLAAQAEARRQQQADAADYGVAPGQVAVMTPTPVPAPAPATVPEPTQLPRGNPAQAGADYTLPSTTQQARVTVPRPARTPPQTTPAPVAQRSEPESAPRTAAMTGPWKIQLGAFSVASGADRLWDRVSDDPALAGAQKVLERAGNLTRLKAGGYASRSAAQAACNRLKSAGQDCLVTR